jgi:hypothetical protein
MAKEPFIAALPKRLLSHPRGAAQAFIGHVDGAYGSSFALPGEKTHACLYTSLIELLLQGYPVGAACDLLDQRYAEVATELSGMIEELRWGRAADAQEIANLWITQNDARNYMVLGDPAVRLLPIPAPDRKPETEPVGAKK